MQASSHGGGPRHQRKGEANGGAGSSSSSSSSSSKGSGGEGGGSRDAPPAVVTVVATTAGGSVAGSLSSKGEADTPAAGAGGISRGASQSWRHVALLWAACFTTTGAYYAKDVLAAVSPQLMHAFRMSKAQYGAIYGLPAIPNIFASIIGGALVDWLGSDRSALLLATVIVAGSILTSLSAPYRLPALLAAGQVFMGIGKGSLITAQKVWIKGGALPGEVSLYFAFSFSTSHAGTFLAFLLSPLVEKASPRGYEAALWLSTGVCAASALCALPLLGVLSPQQGGGGRTSAAAVPSEDDEESKTGAANSSSNSSVASGSVVVYGLRPEWVEKMRYYCRGMWNRGFLLVVISTVCYYLAFFPFVAFSVDYLVHDRGLAKGDAALYGSLLAIGSVVLGPYFGHRVDVELGKHHHHHHEQPQPQPPSPPSRCSRWRARPGTVQVASMVLSGAGLAIVAAAPTMWIVGFVAMGLAFAMASASVWVMVPVFVDGPSLGLAFGVIHAWMDLGLLLVNIGVGRLLDQGHTYRSTVLPILLAINLVALAASLLLLPPLAQAVAARLRRRRHVEEESARAPPSLADADGESSAVSVAEDTATIIAQEQTV